MTRFKNVAGRKREEEFAKQMSGALPRGSRTGSGRAKEHSVAIASPCIEKDFTEANERTNARRWLRKRTRKKKKKNKKKRKTQRKKEKTAGTRARYVRGKPLVMRFDLEIGANLAI